MDVEDLDAPEGWYQDAIRPWVAHRWDGDRWTGEQVIEGRTGMGDPPTSPPHRRRRVTPEELPPRLGGGTRSRVLTEAVTALIVGALLVLLDVPPLLDELSDLHRTADPVSSIPVMVLLLGLGVSTYGIAVLAVHRTRDR